MRRAIINIIKILISLAALLNLAALFLFDYQIPGQWHLSERLHMPFLARFETRQTEFIFQETESEVKQSGIHIEVPAGSIIYNGTGELDLMNNVFVVNADGTSAGDIPVKTKISAGNGRREKIVTYTAETPDGEVLTAQVFPNPDVPMENKEAVIRAKIEEVNATFPAAKRIVNVIFRDHPFVKTASRKIIRARIDE
jgi:hypothetical protein